MEASSDVMFLISISGSDFEFLISFGPYVLALGSSLDLTYWPFGPAWSLDTGVSGQLGPYILAFQASLIRMYWPFGPTWS